VVPGELIPIILFIMVGFTVVGLPIARAIAKKVERGADKPRVPSEVSQRLERMEQALDAMAIEIERISEGQRFTTKLLSERPGSSAALSGQKSS
jgi:hypothetical protein